MHDFNSAAAAKKRSIPPQKLISLVQLRTELTNALPKFSGQLEPLSLRNPRKPSDIKTYSPEQQMQLAVTKVMSRIHDAMQSDSFSERRLPYFTRPGEKRLDSRDRTIDDENTYVELDALYFGCDDGWSVTSSIYAQPNGVGGRYERTHGRKIFAQDQIGDILLAAGRKCEDFTAETGELVHHLAAANPMTSVMAQSEVDKWSKRRKYEFEGKRGPSPF